jgi:hypothetical protein
MLSLLPLSNPTHKKKKKKQNTPIFFFFFFSSSYSSSLFSPSCIGTVAHSLVINKQKHQKAKMMKDDQQVASSS